MSIEEKVKEMIKTKYGTVKDFSKVINIPYTTMCGILKRGFGNAGITNVMKVCNELNISPDALGAGRIEEKTINPLSDDDIILNIENRDIIIEGKKINQEQKEKLLRYLNFIFKEI